MFTRLKLPLTVGMMFYGIAFFVVKFSGFNSESFTVISYLYIILAVLLGVRYEVGKISGSDSALSLLKSVVIVREGEDIVLRRIFTGEKYKIKGEVEKVQ